MYDKKSRLTQFAYDAIAHIVITFVMAIMVICFLIPQ